MVFQLRYKDIEGKTKQAKDVGLIKERRKLNVSFKTVRN